MLYLDGKTISKLERKGSLESDDVFLISRNYNISTENQFSKQVSFDTITDDISEKLNQNIFVSSMGYRETYEYARKNHGHDYSNVHVYMRTPQFLRRFSVDGELMDIAQISVVNEGVDNRIQVKIPAQKYEAKKYVPRIGELKFYALNKLDPVDINSKDFDGYVYPDGSTYSKSRFPEAWEVFAKERSSSTFQVPNLNTFFKPNPFAYQGNSLSVVPGENNGIPSHKHEISNDKFKFNNANITTSAKIPANQTCDEDDDEEHMSGDKSIHARGSPHGGGLAGWGQGDRLQESDYTLKIKNVKMTASGGEFQSAGDNAETHPSFNLLPVKIYIGGVKDT